MYALHATGGVVRFKEKNFALRYQPKEGSVSAVVWGSAPSQMSLNLCLLNSPSGSGKTTFLNNLYRYVLGFGSDLKFDFRPDNLERERSIGAFIPQHPPMVHHWRVRDLVPKNPDFLPAFFPERADDVLKRRLGQLSGGEGKRVYASSALERLCRSAAPAKFLCLDETLDGLGAIGASRVLAAIADTWAKRCTVPLYAILVTHLNPAELNLSASTHLSRLALKVVAEAGGSADIAIGTP